MVELRHQRALLRKRLEEQRLGEAARGRPAASRTPAGQGNAEEEERNGETAGELRLPPTQTAEGDDGSAAASRPAAEALLEAVLRDQRAASARLGEVHDCVRALDPSGVRGELETLRHRLDGCLQGLEREMALLTAEVRAGGRDGARPGGQEEVEEGPDCVELYAASKLQLWIRDAQLQAAAAAAEEGPGGGEDGAKDDDGARPPELPEGSAADEGTRGDGEDGEDGEECHRPPDEAPSCSEAGETALMSEEDLADLLFDLETTNAKNLAVTTELEKKSLRARIAELEAQLARLSKNKKKLKKNRALKGAMKRLKKLFGP